MSAATSPRELLAGMTAQLGIDLAEVKTIRYHRHTGQLQIVTAAGVQRFDTNAEPEPEAPAKPARKRTSSKPKKKA